MGNRKWKDTLYQVHHNIHEAVAVADDAAVESAAVGTVMPELDKGNVHHAFHREHNCFQAEIKRERELVL